jgi:muramoyltetrapeptide carboxypeptidase LdcA involved in peptidoglycan recycling
MLGSVNAFVRPRRLAAGDLVAVVSPSWGGPATFAAPYERGLAVLREDLGLRVRELPTARASAAWLAANPRARADDLRAAFEDPEVRAIVASIGGEDAIRVLPHLDPGIMRRCPKILLGYSDTSALLAWAAANGLVAFHGPSVMAGIAQARALPPAYLAHLRAMLFEARESYAYEPYGVFAEGYPDWRTSPDPGAVKPLQPDLRGWRFLQGQGRARARSSAAASR